jgi:hypothetical protein
VAVRQCFIATYEDGHQFPSTQETADEWLRMISQGFDDNDEEDVRVVKVIDDIRQTYILIGSDVEYLVPVCRKNMGIFRAMTRNRFSWYYELLLMRMARDVAWCDANPEFCRDAVRHVMEEIDGMYAPRGLICSRVAAEARRSRNGTFLQWVKVKQHTLRSKPK